jgi:site-specific DNA-cytosine methylase
VLAVRDDRIANTVTANLSKEHYLTDLAMIRRLTPVECERLQGFPDNWTLGSDTQRYKQCGNAVTVNVVEAVISGLMPCLIP